MKLQNLIILFLAIALPVIIILSVYVEMQVKTSALREQYTDALINSAHEAMVAFQINTANDAYSNVTDVKIRDIQAAFNVFASALSTNFGATGATKGYSMTYVPVAAFTLYDGYYIYMPTESRWDVTENREAKNNAGAYGSDTAVNEYTITYTDPHWKKINMTHEMKAYVHYVKEYNNGSKTFIVNFTLDNFVTAYYFDKNSGIYESRGGYLEDTSKRNEVKQMVNKISDNDDKEKVKEYYEEAWKFTEWFNDRVGDINTSENQANKLKIDSLNLAMPEEASTFNDVKYDVIKDSITKNLRQAMQIYGNRMPKLTGEDWDLILNNVCLIAFMQGMPVGTTMYNDYTIAVSTENKETVRGIDLYFVGEGAHSDGRYHRIWCPHLEGDKIKGYYKSEFVQHNITPDQLQEGYTQPERSDLQETLACYYCVVRSSHATWEYAEPVIKHDLYGQLDDRKSAYFSSLIREKVKLSTLKQTGFVSGSRTIKGTTKGNSLEWKELSPPMSW